MKTIGLLGHHEEKFTHNYIVAINACDAEAVVLDTAPQNALRTVDGIIISGGADLNPSLYGEANISARNVNDALDKFELEVLNEAVNLKKPIFGICRGEQLVNVFFGGNLIQNVEHIDLHSAEKPVDLVHTTHVHKDSFLYTVYHSEEISVNSAHHQAVNRLGANLTSVQESDDGLIEAIAHNNLPIFGVQWHPERMCLNYRRSDTVDGLDLFRYFINSFIC